jgi:hypothetical protein
MLNPLNAAWGRIRAASKRVKESNTTGEQALGAGTGYSWSVTQSSYQHEACAFSMLCHCHA